MNGLKVLFHTNLTWMANEVSNQLKHGISLCDVKFAPQLEIIKPLHAKLTVDLYTHMQEPEKIMVSNQPE